MPLGSETEKILGFPVPSNTGRRPSTEQSDGRGEYMNHDLYCFGLANKLRITLIKLAKSLRKYVGETYEGIFPSLTEQI